MFWEVKTCQRFHQNQLKWYIMIRAWVNVKPHCQPPWWEGWEMGDSTRLRGGGGFCWFWRPKFQTTHIFPCWGVLHRLLHCAVKVKARNLEVPWSKSSLQIDQFDCWRRPLMIACHWLKSRLVWPWLTYVLGQGLRAVPHSLPSPPAAKLGPGSVVVAGSALSTYRSLGHWALTALEHKSSSWLWSDNQRLCTCHCLEVALSQECCDCGCWELSTSLHILWAFDVHQWYRYLIKVMCLECSWEQDLWQDGGGVDCR